jgi:hypothetical protein
METYDFLYHSEFFVDLLNRTAPVFFSDHQSLLFESFVLGVGRILDRATSRGQENYTLDLLRERIEATNQHSDLCGMLKEGRESLLAHSRSLLKLRHRLFGHRDGRLARSIAKARSFKAELHGVKELLEHIDEMMNAVAIAYRRNATFFCLIPADAAQQLVSSLQSRKCLA